MLKGKNTPSLFGARNSTISSLFWREQRGESLSENGRCYIQLDKEGERSKRNGLRAEDNEDGNAVEHTS